MAVWAQLWAQALVPQFTHLSQAWNSACLTGVLPPGESQVTCRCSAKVQAQQPCPSHPCHLRPAV